jgi:hypothetical protein
MESARSPVLVRPQLLAKEPTKAYLGFICEGFGRGSPQEIIAFSAKDALTVDFAPIEIY